MCLRNLLKNEEMQAVLMFFVNLLINMEYGANQLHPTINAIVFGGIVECALAYQPGDSGFESHFSREFSGGAWITLHTEAANQE
jgi:hypothetical protein